ncbi:putative lipoprotein, partial [hydrothermal vent metagenome]
WGGMGWGGMGWGGTNVSTRTEGSLYIDLIDAKNKELIWQGKGVGTLGNSKNMERKEQRIREFVAEILQQYPPNAIAAN